MQVLDIHNQSELQTANGWRGKQQSGQAVKTGAMSKHRTVTRAEAGGQTWRTWLPLRPPPPLLGLVEGDDKRPASTPYKSVTMGMWIRRVGADFTPHLSTSCWMSASGSGVRGGPGPSRLDGAVDG